MQTKLGIAVPEDLAIALQASRETLQMWDRLRPSCQRRYVEFVMEARKEDTRRRRVSRVLEMTAAYCARHPLRNAGR